jgi:hypothetical protein
MSAVAESAPSAAPRAAWVCLAIAWLTFLLPIPGIGLFIGWPLNLVAFILAIVAMSKQGTMAGLFQLLASLVVSPVVYFIGWMILAGSLVAAGEASNVEAVSEPAQVATPAVQADAMAVAASALYAAYDANEIAADQQFKGKLLKVTGTIEAIDSDLTDEPVVRLAAGDFDSVMVKGLPATSAASLSKGQQVTVVCQGGGEVIGSPVLDDCVM